MNTKEIERWRAIETEDIFLVKDLKKKNEKISDYFNSKIKFGTAGLRGMMGAGTSNINVHTIAAATQAYAEFLKENNTKKNLKVVIGHDNRYNGELFTDVAASVFQKNGIKAYKYVNNDLQPTPLVSFTIRSEKLDGGIIITASHNPKEYNGYKVYDSKGAQLLLKDTNAIADKMEKLDFLSIQKEEWIENYIKDSIVQDYIERLEKIRLKNTKDNSNKKIKATFTAQHGTAAKIMPELMASIGHDVEVVKKQQLPLPDFKYTKIPNPEDGKAFIRAVNLARRNKSGIIFSTDPDADRLGVVVKHEKRFKYLNGNQLASLYLDFMLKSLHEQNKIPKNGYIVTTFVSGHLAKKIASKYNIKIYETHVGFKNISSLIEYKKKSENFIFAYEESCGFLLDHSIVRDKDAFQAAVATMEMAQEYFDNNIDLYQKLKELYCEYGVHRSTVLSKQMSPKIQSDILKKMSKIKTLGSKKVSKIIDFRKGLVIDGNSVGPQKLVKVIFEDGSWIALRPSGTEPKMKVYIETIGSKDEDLINIIKFEKEVDDFLVDNSEEFLPKKFSIKTVTKYVTFTSIVIGILVFVFLIVFKQTSTASKGTITTWTMAEMIVNTENKGIWLSLWIWNMFTILLSGWTIKRMFAIQGEKVKLSHLFISSAMGGIISFITPFAVGGDAIGYWYLRRKGVKRDTLLASLTSHTMLQEAKYSIQTIILFGVGFGLFKQIFFNNDQEAHGALVMFIVGFTWNIFSTFMIFLLALSKNVQEFITRIALKFLEWFRFVHIYDPDAKLAIVQYEFSMMRNGMKLIWKRWWFPIELLFYSMLPLFIAPAWMVLSSSGVINPNNHLGSYWSQIVATDISGTANSLSLTPGGSGTGEWLDVTINNVIYGNSNFMADNHLPANSSRAVASGVNLVWKCLYSWPWLAMSALTAFSVILYENKISRIRKINKNISLNGGTKISEIRNIKIKTTIFWVVVIACFITLFFTVIL